jgi:lysophospholipase L1-like esterase
MFKQITRMAGMLFALPALAFLAGCEQDGSKFGEGYDFGVNNGKLVLVMGDSITAGGFSGSAPWPARFGAASGFGAINDGISGATSGLGSARIGGMLAATKPGFVIIGFGANDAILSRSPDDTAGNIRNMIVTALNNNTIPVVSTVMPMSGGRSIYNGTVMAINERIKNIASEYNVRVVDLYAAVGSDPDQYYADGLHLNDLGENLVAIEYTDVFNSGNPRIMPVTPRIAGQESPGDIKPATKSAVLLHNETGKTDGHHVST